MVEKNDAQAPAKGANPANSAVSAEFAKPNPLELFWEKYHKVVYTVVCVGLVIWVVVHFVKQAQERERSRQAYRVYDESNMLESFPSWNSAVSLAEKADAKVLAGLITDRAGTEMEPYLRAIQIRRLVEKGKVAKAKEEIAYVKEHFKGHPILTKPIKYAFHPAPLSLIGGIEAVMADNAQAKEKYPRLFSNPEPEKAFTVTVQTDRGSFKIQLYPDRAPKHVGAFCANVLKGFYDKQKICRACWGGDWQGRYIEFGDPNTKDVKKTRADYGKGGWDEKLAKEKNDLCHFAGAVTCYTKRNGDKETSSQLVRIMATPYHDWDGEYNVIGQVVEGLDVVDAIIENAEFDKPTMREGVPVVPPVIEKVTISGDYSKVELPKPAARPVDVKDPKKGDTDKKAKPAHPDEEDGAAPSDGKKKARPHPDDVEPGDEVPPKKPAPKK